MEEGGHEPIPEEPGEEFRPGREGRESDALEERRAEEREREEERRRKDKEQGARSKTKKSDGKTYTRLEPPEDIELRNIKSPSGVVDPSHEGEERPPSPPTNTRKAWVQTKDGKRNVMVDVGEEVQEECRSLVDGIYKNVDYTKLMFGKREDGWKVVRLRQEGSVYYVITDDGKILNRKSSEVPKTIKKALGKTRVEKGCFGRRRDRSEGTQKR